MHSDSNSVKEFSERKDADTMEKIVLDSAIKFGAGRYRQDRNILEDCGKEIRRFGKKAFVVAGPRAFEAVKERLLAGFELLSGVFGDIPAAGPAFVAGGNRGELYGVVHCYVSPGRFLGLWLQSLDMEANGKRLLAPIGKTSGGLGGNYRLYSRGTTAFLPACTADFYRIPAEYPF